MSGQCKGGIADFKDFVATADSALPIAKTAAAIDRSGDPVRADGGASGP